MTASCSEGAVFIVIVIILMSPPLCRITWLYYYSVKTYLLIYYLLIKQNVVGDTHTQSLPSAGWLPKGHTVQDWVRVKPGTRDSIWVFHQDGRGPSTWDIVHHYLRHVVIELDRKWSSRDFSCCLSTGWWCQRQQLNPLHGSAGPLNTFLHILNIQNILK